MTLRRLQLRGNTLKPAEVCKDPRDVRTPANTPAQLAQGGHVTLNISGTENIREQTSRLVAEMMSDSIYTRMLDTGRRGEPLRIQAVTFGSRRYESAQEVTRGPEGEVLDYSVSRSIYGFAPNQRDMDEQSRYVRRQLCFRVDGEARTIIGVVRRRDVPHASETTATHVISEREYAGAIMSGYYGLPEQPGPFDPEMIPGPVHGISADMLSFQGNAFHAYPWLLKCAQHFDIPLFTDSLSESPNPMEVYAFLAGMVSHALPTITARRWVADNTESIQRYFVQAMRSNRPPTGFADLNPIVMLRRLIYEGRAGFEV